MDSRQQFEEWYKESGMTKYKETALAAWEASRESMVVELPEVHRDVTFDDESIDLMWPDEVIKAIHAAGIRTK